MTGTQTFHVGVAVEGVTFADQHVDELALELARRGADLVLTPRISELAKVLQPLCSSRCQAYGLAVRYAQDAVLRAFIKDRELKT